MSADDRRPGRGGTSGGGTNHGQRRGGRPSSHRGGAGGQGGSREGKPGGGWRGGDRDGGRTRFGDARGGEQRGGDRHGQDRRGGEAQGSGSHSGRDGERKPWSRKPDGGNAQGERGSAYKGKRGEFGGGHAGGHKAGGGKRWSPRPEGEKPHDGPPRERRDEGASRAEHERPARREFSRDRSGPDGGGRGGDKPWRPREDRSHRTHEGSSREERGDTKPWRSERPQNDRPDRGVRNRDRSGGDGGSGKRWFSRPDGDRPRERSHGEDRPRGDAAGQDGAERGRRSGGDKRPGAWVRKDKPPFRGGERRGDRGEHRGGGERRFGSAASGARREDFSAASSSALGLPARQLAVFLIAAVLRHNRALDDALADSLQEPRWAKMEPRDRGLARLIAGSVLRNRGRLEAVLNAHLSKPLPKNQGKLWPILLSGAAQLLLLATPPHAAISLAVDQVRGDAGARRFDKLANAVLRKVANDGAERFATLDAVSSDVPAWLLQRWVQAYGEETARRIAAASLAEAPLDLSVKADAASWAERLGGELLPTGSVRLAAGGRVDEMPGFAEGAWWVQDAAAALPAKLLGNVAGLAVVDLCAAPGGKTAELAAAGANVTACELSPERAPRITANLERLGLKAEVVIADATSWAPERTFDAVLLDAPCTATGTIRRHPDILHLKRDSDIAALAEVQRALLANAARLVRSGGLLVYCVCSLEPEEGPTQVAAFLAAHPDFAREPVGPAEVGGLAELIDAAGDLRTLPFHMPRERSELSGLDGFYATRLRRSAS